jgi:hypothetical protein
VFFPAKLWILFHLGPATIRLHAINWVFMSWAEQEKIITVQTKHRFHDITCILQILYSCSDDG